MAAVVMALSTALVADPALSRVEPVSTSGPVRDRDHDVGQRGAGPGRGAQVTSTVRAPARAGRLQRAAHERRHRAGGDARRAGRAVRSRAAARAGRRRRGPPRLPRRGTPRRRPPPSTARMRSGSLPNVGGHSAASSTPSRPLVPAPRNTTRPPPASARATMAGRARDGRRSRAAPPPAPAGPRRAEEPRPRAVVDKRVEPRAARVAALGEEPRPGTRRAARALTG